MENLIEKIQENYMSQMKNFINDELMIMEILAACDIENDNCIEIEKQYSIEDELRTGVIIKTNNPITNVSGGVKMS